MKVAVAVVAVSLSALIPTLAHAEAPPVDVAWSSPTPGVRFDVVRVDGLARPGAPQPSCVAPCAVALAPGRYAVALSLDGESRVAGQVDLVAPGTVEGVYTSRAGARRAGWYTLIAGLAAGFTLGALSIHRPLDCITYDTAPPTTDCIHDRITVDGGLLLSGIVVAGVGAGVGSWLLRRQDEVTLRVLPTLGAARGDDGLRRGTSEGFALQLAF